MVRAAVPQGVRQMPQQLAIRPSNEQAALLHVHGVVNRVHFQANPDLQRGAKFAHPFTQSPEHQTLPFSSDMVAAEYRLITPRPHFAHLLSLKLHPTSCVTP